MHKQIRRILVGLGNISCLLAVLLAVGCSDTDKRAAGRNLQSATAEANVYYAKAVSILGNPALVDGQDGGTVEPETLSPEALKALDKAEEILLKALRDNYESRQADLDSVPQADVAVAQLTLGMVRNMRGQYYIWATEKSLEAGDDSLANAHIRLLDVERADAIVYGFQKQIKNAQDSIDKLAGSAAEIDKSKAEVAKKKAVVDGKIKAFRSDIAALEKTISEDSAKASDLKKQSSLATGEESLKKLEEALKIEETIHANRFKIGDIEDKIKAVTGDLDYLNYQISQADFRLAEIDKKRKAWTQKLAKDKEYLEKQETRVQTLWGEVAKLQNSAAEACWKGFNMSGKARGSLDSAQKNLDQAGRLDSPKKAQIVSEDADSKVKSAKLQLTLWAMNRKIGNFTKRAEAVWGQLHVDKPAEAVNKTLNAYIEKTNTCGETAVADAKQAVSMREKALKAGDSSRRWCFQWDLARAYLVYAQALHAGGKQSEAADVLGKASELIVEIEPKAKTAGEYPSVLELKKLVEAASGKTS